jgi:hypothetical protein
MGRSLQGFWALSLQVPTQGHFRNNYSKSWLLQKNALIYVRCCNSKRQGNRYLGNHRKQEQAKESGAGKERERDGEGKNKKSEREIERERERERENEIFRDSMPGRVRRPRRKFQGGKSGE